MASFLEKLKRGMGIEEDPQESFNDNPEDSIEEKIKESLQDADSEDKPFENMETESELASIKTPRKKRAVKQKKLEIKSIALDQTLPSPEKQNENDSIVENNSVPVHSLQTEEKEESQWFGDEGQLAVDIYQTEDYLVIQSAIAGVRPEDLNIVMEKDMISIKGSRKNPCGESCDYFSQECFWGSFSREIILPTEVDPNHAEATMKGGVLLIKMPKIMREKIRKIVVKDTA